MNPVDPAGPVSEISVFPTRILNVLPNAWIKVNRLALKISKTICIVFHSSKTICRSKGGTVVRALAFHQCCPGSNPSVDAICGLSLLLVLSFAPRGFPPGTLVFPSPQKSTFPNSNSTKYQVSEETLSGCATSIIYIIYLYPFSF